MKNVFVTCLLFFSFIFWSFSQDSKLEFSKGKFFGDVYVVDIGNGFSPLKNAMNIPNELLAQGGGQCLGVGVDYLWGLNSTNKNIELFYIGFGTTMNFLNYRFKKGIDNSDPSYNDYDNIKIEQERLVTSFFQWDITHLTFKVIPIPDKMKGVSFNFHLCPVSLYLGKLNSVNVKSGNVRGVGFNANVSLSWNFSEILK